MAGPELRGMSAWILFRSRFVTLSCFLSPTTKLAKFMFHSFFPNPLPPQNLNQARFPSHPKIEVFTNHPRNPHSLQILSMAGVSLFVEKPLGAFASAAGDPAGAARKGTSSTQSLESLFLFIFLIFFHVN